MKQGLAKKRRDRINRMDRTGKEAAASYIALSAFLNLDNPANPV
jgi:hypothetical protein